MTECLQLWLQNAATIIRETQPGVNYSPEADTSSMEDQLSFVGEYLFFGQFDSVTPGRGSRHVLDSVVNEIHQIYEVHVHRHEKDDLMYLFLGFAVSQMSPGRAEFIQGILRLEDEVQQDLMQRIQEFQSTMVQREENERDGPRTSQTTDGAASSGEQRHISLPPPTTARSEHFCMGADDAAVEETCLQCLDKDTRIERLRTELKKQLADWTEQRKKLEEDLSVETNKVVDVELMVLRNNEEIFKKEQIIVGLEKKAAEQQAALGAKANLEEQLATLQDEVDVLRPQAARADTVQNQLERSRKRLEELSAIKQQLTNEMISHEQTTQKLSQVEQELEALRKLKTQLEEYKELYAEATLSIDELQLRLRSSDEKLETLQSENMALSGGQLEHLTASQNLAEQLKATSEQLRTAERSAGLMNEGVNEFNPALMQEMQRLRSENKELGDRLSQCDVEHLQSLERKLTDADSRVNSLQKKYMATKDSLEDTLRREGALTMQLTHLQGEHAALQILSAERSALAAEDISSQRAGHLVAIECLVQTAAEELQKTVDSYEAQVSRLSQDLHESTETCAQTHAHLLELQQEHAVLNGELAQEKKKRKCEFEEHESELARRKLDNENEVSALTSQLQDHQARTTATLQKMKAEQQVKLNALATEYEEESSKRRKSDRAKKFFEAEVSRLKIQLSVAISTDSTTTNSSGSSTSSDLRAALQEIKSMQQQLDAAHAEIASLRTLSSSTSSSLLSSVTQTAKPQFGSGSNTASAVGEYESGPVATTATNTKLSRVGAALRVPTASSSAVGPSSSSCSLASTASTISGSERALGSAVVANAPSIVGSRAIGALGDGLVDRVANHHQSGGFVEHAELADRRVDQLTREKRGMLSRTLEESKEKMELSQKLLVNEKEIEKLKTEVRKVTLEKERLERKMIKMTGSATGPSKVIVPGPPLRPRDENIPI